MISYYFLLSLSPDITLVGFNNATCIASKYIETTRKLRIEGAGKSQNSVQYKVKTDSWGGGGDRFFHHIII
jgi:hypothetical protein